MDYHSLEIAQNLAMFPYAPQFLWLLLLPSGLCMQAGKDESQSKHQRSGQGKEGKERKKAKKRNEVTYKVNCRIQMAHWFEIRGTSHRVSVQGMTFSKPVTSSLVSQTRSKPYNELCFRTLFKNSSPSMFHCLPRRLNH